MEFAVSALLLLVLLLPGFILHNLYAKGLWRWNSPVTPPLTEQIPVSIVLAAVLHVIWVALAQKVCCTVRLDAAMMFLLGDFGKDSEHLLSAIHSITDHPLKVAGYFISLYILSAALGLFLHWVVRRCHLDHRYRMFRFNNEWFYWLSGEITQFRETPDIQGKVEGVYVSTIVKNSEGDFLYRGYLRDYFFDKAGNLDRILLNATERRKLGKDKQTPNETPEDEAKRYYPLDGHYFILRYSEISTLNLKYLIFLEVEDSTQPDLEIDSLEELIKRIETMTENINSKFKPPAPQD